MILENLRFSVTTVHVRFEDSSVSRRDQNFNFGLMADKITYSMTNNRFSRAFLNIDDKISEQKSFSMLIINKFAMYWNSDAQENWTKSKDFGDLKAARVISFSKKHMENLLMNHHNKKHDYTHNSVFLIQPCDLTLKFRTNLAPHLRPEIPESTIALETNEILLSLDEEVYKDI